MSYTERNSSIKFANTEKSVKALFRLGIILTSEKKSYVG